MTPELEQNVFRALADPTRREILRMLSSQEQSIAEVAEQFDITRGAVKKHLTILEQGQLIRVTQKGRERVNQLQPQNLQHAADWLSYFSHFWDSKLDSLQNLINQQGE